LSETRRFEYQAYIELYLSGNQDLLLGATSQLFFQCPCCDVTSSKHGRNDEKLKKELPKEREL